MTKESAEGSYRVEIKHEVGETFTLIEYRLIEDKETNRIISSGIIYKIDEHYVLETDDKDLMTLHFLSDKQVKLNDLLFERENEE